MWMALGADSIVAKQIIEMVMEKLVIMAPYVDKKESMIRGGTTKVATNQPLAVSHKHLTDMFLKLSSIPNRNQYSLCLFVFSDDMWAQRAVIKWSQSGASSQSVSSALLLSHSQTGSQCRCLTTQGQQH